jgi:hypothetical protein
MDKLLNIIQGGPSSVSSVIAKMTPGNPPPNPLPIGAGSPNPSQVVPANTPKPKTPTPSLPTPTPKATSVVPPPKQETPEDRKLRYTAQRLGVMGVFQRLRNGDNSGVETLPKIMHPEKYGLENTDWAALTDLADAFYQYSDMSTNKDVNEVTPEQLLEVKNKLIAMLRSGNFNADEIKQAQMMANGMLKTLVPRSKAEMQLEGLIKTQKMKDTTSKYVADARLSGQMASVNETIRNNNARNLVAQHRLEADIKRYTAQGDSRNALLLIKERDTAIKEQKNAQDLFKITENLRLGWEKLAQQDKIDTAKLGVDEQNTILREKALTITKMGNDAGTLIKLYNGFPSNQLKKILEPKIQAIVSGLRSVDPDIANSLPEIITTDYSSKAADTVARGAALRTPVSTPPRSNPGGQEKNPSGVPSGALDVFRGLKSRVIGSGNVEAAFIKFLEHKGMTPADYGSQPDTEKIKILREAESAFQNARIIK